MQNKVYYLLWRSQVVIITPLKAVWCRLPWECPPSYVYLVSDLVREHYKQVLLLLYYMLTMACCVPRLRLYESHPAHQAFQTSIVLHLFHSRFPDNLTRNTRSAKAEPSIPVPVNETSVIELPELLPRIWMTPLSRSTWFWNVGSSLVFPYELSTMRMPQPPIIYSHIS